MRSWHLLREGICYLEKNSEKWRQRRLKQVDKIKQKDKAGRLAVVAIKKKRYGIGKLTKDETKGMNKGTEERLMLAKVRENLWRKQQVRVGVDSDAENDLDDMTESEREAWSSLE